MNASATHPAKDLSAFRTALLIILAAALLGTMVELLLLEHVEGFWQKVPIGLLLLGLVAVAWQGIRPNRTSLRAFRVTMILLLVSGPAGLLLHYRGNVEFEREMQPSAGRFTLFWEAIRGATPALAPGSMILLGVLGLLYAWGAGGSALGTRHSALGGELMTRGMNDAR